MRLLNDRLYAVLLLILGKLYILGVEKSGTEKTKGEIKMVFARIFDRMFTDDERKMLMKNIEELQNRYNSDCKNQYLMLRALTHKGKTVEVFVNNSGVVCLFNIYD